MAQEEGKSKLLIRGLLLEIILYNIIMGCWISYTIDISLLQILYNLRQMFPDIATHIHNKS